MSAWDDPDRARLVPVIHKSRRDGYEVECQRINKYGERASSMVITELTIADLQALSYELVRYLDEGQYQE